MYRWYQDAKVCYVHLADVWCNCSQSRPELDMESFRNSSWFTRGWNLQELLAPSHVRFFDQTWQYVGSRRELAAEISVITGIDSYWLWSSDDFVIEKLPCTKARDCPAHWNYSDWDRIEPSLATRMSWASKRKTSRVEDMAYCLLGLFNVNMPLLYGEGRKAFQRLQHEIMKQTDDDSIFAWTNSMGGVLADWPSVFAGSRYVHKHRRYPRPPYSMTNQGLHFPITWRSVQQRPGPPLLSIPLNCGMCGSAGFQNLVMSLHPWVNGVWNRPFSEKPCGNGSQTLPQSNDTSFKEGTKATHSQRSANAGTSV